MTEVASPLWRQIPLTNQVITDW